MQRQSDGYVYSDEEFKGHFKSAKLKRLFNVPRLNRNKKGRPIGVSINMTCLSVPWRSDYAND